MSIDLRTRQGWEDLKRILDDRPEDVLRMCKLDVPTRRTTIVTDDPLQRGRNNFAIWLKADGLSWKNYTTGECGRSLELIAYCQGWYDLAKRGSGEAARYAIAQLGLGSIDSAQLERDRASAQQRQHQARADIAEELRRKQGAAYHTFVKESAPVLGTGAEIYLRDARGIDLRGDPFIGPRGGIVVPHALRFKASHKYIHRDRKGKKYAESYHPCLIACCVDADMKIRAIHQTYLADDFSDKAQLAPAPDGYEQKARKVWPDSAGLVIPLWRGEGNYSPKEAAELGLIETLSLSEGVEDGLSEVLAAPQHRTWAMISLSNMVNVAARLPASCDSVIVHRQNDWQKIEAVTAFDRGMAAIRATGRAAAEVAAVGGKDLNDTLRGAA